MSVKKIAALSYTDGLYLGTCCDGLWSFYWTGKLWVGT